ncbi:MAG: phosphoribosylformylglycinamidine synthase subunit PurL [Patescibacteria group bacterium]
MSQFQETILEFSKYSDDEVKQMLKKYGIALTVAEARKVETEILKRPPTLTEAVVWGIEGSEHCSYKSSRPHLKQFVTDAPNVILGPQEDSGIIEIARDNNGDRYGIIISHESHNHPSQIVPYEGAATGIGGIVRDVICMGGKVIACADPLRFGDIKTHKTKWIHDGVVSGIAGYGNPIGVPNIAGDLYYHPSYNDNCLVNVVSIGVIRESDVIHSRAPKDSLGYDIILVGKPTDNSGFGGASFASLELDETQKEQNKGAVQEPNAFLKRHLLESTYELFKILKEKNLLAKVGFKDLGAGGVCCASVELVDSAGMGADIDLEKVHISMAGLHPSVVLCSETQERFMWVAHPDVTSLIVSHYNERWALPKVSEGAQASVIGKVTNGNYVVYYQGTKIVDAPSKQVTEGLLYNREYLPGTKNLTEPDSSKLANLDLNKTVLDVLAHENVASRLAVYEQYDKQVQGQTIIESGQADAGVLAPFLEPEWPDEIKKVGMALAVDHNPRYGLIDAYWCGANAVCEAMRNVAAVGATPQCITDCLCFGNPEKPEQMWEFVQGTKGVAEACKGIHLKEYPENAVPIISGNVSFYNESKNGSVAPSPIIACVGRLADYNQAVTMEFKKPGSAIYLVGERKDELGGSVLYDLIGELGANLPKPDFTQVQNQIWAVAESISQGVVNACHDISDGGIVTTLAEMCFGGHGEKRMGIEVKSQKSKVKNFEFLFSETGGFVCEVSDEKKFKDIMNQFGVQAQKLGQTTADGQFKINDWINLDISTMARVWLEGLRSKL